MGIRGLSSYIHEHLDEVLVRYKLHHSKIVIDGNNLAHILYFQCTGINAAFGGDYDKYATFIEEFFKGLQACEVYPIVVMDGGQPLDNKKMNTVRERVTNQIQTCLHISPSNQFRLKIFPPMGRDVFVSTLKKMGIIVLQTDFEADLEIAILAKKFGLTVLSNDSDFYMFDVPFILLSSITYNKISIGKKRRSNEMFNYISCYHFNQEKFCQITGIDIAHFPILATVLGNDYLAFDHFKEFYNHLDMEAKKSRMTSRHNTIKNVLTWLSRQKGKNVEEVIAIVASHSNTKNLRIKMRATMKNYYHGHSNLINMVSQNALKYTCDDTKRANYFSIENSEEKNCVFQTSHLTEMTNVETSLFCKNGRKLPNWFVLAYRAHRIPHDVADIVTQQYFISPPQIEDKLSFSAYLLVEPIVRIVYTMLWKNPQSQYCDQIVCNYDSLSLRDDLSGNYILEPSSSQSCEIHNFDSWTASEMYDSDVVVESSSEESLDDELEHRIEEIHSLKQETYETEIDHNSHSELQHENTQINGEVFDENAGNKKMCSLKKKDDEILVVNEEMAEILGKNVEKRKIADQCDPNNETFQSKKKCLQWYLRKGNKMWIKKIPQLSREKANELPSLSEVGLMSVSEKKKVFYSILKSNLQSSVSEIPEDLELIFGFIIFWYQESASSLMEIHVLSVLVCMFMFYIIDGKVGRIRTRKAFEDEEKWKKQFSTLKNDASYCSPSATVEELLTQVSEEECLLAGHKLFRFHHMNQKVSDIHYNRKTVHAFSEYQACIYFMQLLNTLLDSPFPLLSIEHLWGGTFCYNIFYDLKRRRNPLTRVTEILGKGSCLEKLFLIFFKQLSEILNFTKYLKIIDQENMISLESEKKLCDENVPMLENIMSQKKKKRRDRKRTSRKSNCNDENRKDSKEEEVDQEEEEKSEMCLSNITEEREQRVDLLDNRFAELLLIT